jgi:hypothetical protein
LIHLSGRSRERFLTMPWRFVGCRGDSCCGIITRQLHAEAIASSMLCAAIFAAWFGGFGPAQVAIALVVLVFYYYLVPLINPPPATKGRVRRFNSRDPYIKSMCHD